MLKELQIQNLALIEKLHIDFDNELTVFTGETGAGKSIILQAIDLLSGGRGAASWIRTGMEQAQIEALFEISDHKTLRTYFDEMGLECDEEVLIKRTFKREGKSRYYINGSLATAKLVSQLSEKLISVGSQRDHQQLLLPQFHLDFIDLIGELWKEREEIGDLYTQWTSARSEIAQLKEREQEKDQRRDFLTYQVKEISEASPEPGEDEKIAVEKQRLKSVDDLRRMGVKSLKSVMAATDLLAEARSDLITMSELDSGISETSELITEQSFLAEEYARTLRDYVDGLPHDGGNLEDINARIHQLQQLKRKYGSTLEEVIAFGEKAMSELDEIAGLDERLEIVSKEYAKLEQLLVEKAQQLSIKRQKVAQSINETVTHELKDLSFEQAKFEVVFQNDNNNGIEAISSTGWDSASFMFSANPGEPVKPLVKIASGGELSRVMLALKCVLAKKDFVDTVIFDEVDAGIGGIAAEAVARKIKELSTHHQVLCITHLPQIASKGKVHFQVTKELIEGRTNTQIGQLDHEDRVQELARMLDGDSVSDKSIAFARELVSRNSSL